jgi:DNA helicase-2/ATP-dependent DNA helicase PcrA
VSWGEFGVLIRTNNLARRIEESFLAEQVPYRISGGTSFYGRKEIKDVISYLRVIANPDDDIHLLRIINTPRRGIGKTTIEKLTAMARSRNASLRTAMELVRRDALQGDGAAQRGGIPAGADAGALSEKAAADVSAFLDLVDEYREHLLGKKRIAAKVRELMDKIDYWGYLVEENKQNEKAATWKFHNLEILIHSIEEWEKDPDNLAPGLYEWLNRVSLITRDDLLDDEGGEVNLMTIHAAKGLEFDVVFIAGCEDGIIPHARSLEEGEGSLEEERRLFYVAVTRARRRLLISSCLRRRRQNQIMDCVPSPFLQEIPSGLVQACAGESEFSEEEGAAQFGRLMAMFGGDAEAADECRPKGK